MIPSTRMTRATRHNWSIFLLLAITATALLLTHQATRAIERTSRSNVTENPGYQHSVRMQVAAARAALDALGMAGAADQAAYQADYRLQRMQLLADGEGLERWAAHDAYRQGLTQEIRASMAGFLLALDETVNPQAVRGNSPPVPLLPALNRCEMALRNYCGSLSGPASLAQSARSSDAEGPAFLWILLGVLLLELAALAIVVFSEPLPSSQS